MKRWIVGCLLVGCSGASSAALDDAGRLLVDAGEVLSDAGQALSDAGAELSDSGRAHAQTMVSCVDEGNGYWYAETTVAEDADVDAWLCDPDPATVPARSPTSCQQTDVELDGTKLRAFCGFQNSLWHTLRVRIR